MTTFQFRNGFEEGVTVDINRTSMYPDYDVEILIENKWVSATTVSDIKGLIPTESTTSSHIIEGDNPLYISDDMVAIFSVEQIALAIASDPSGRHEIQWSSQTSPIHGGEIS